MSSGQTSSLLSPVLMRKGLLPQRATPFSCLHNQKTLEASELPLPRVLHLFLPLWPRVLKRLLQNKMSEILSRAEGLQCWETPEDLYRRWMSHIGETRTGLLHSSQLTLQRVNHLCTFLPGPIRPVRVFLWDSTSATLLSVGRWGKRTDHSKEKHSEQYLAVGHLVEIFVRHVDLKRVHTCSKTKFKGVAM